MDKAYLYLRGLARATPFVGGGGASAANAEASQQALRPLGFVPAAWRHGEGSRAQQAHQLGVARPGRGCDDISNGQGSCLRTQRPVHAAVLQAIPFWLFWVSRRNLHHQHKWL